MNASRSFIISKIENENYKKYCEKIKSSELSIFDYSKIMKEYKNNNKNQKNFQKKFSIGYNITNIKLRYRASDHKKFEIKELFNLENLFINKRYIFIMKITNDVYFYFDKDYNAYCFTKNEFKPLDEFKRFEIIEHMG